jgi:hypothetical protein
MAQDALHSVKRFRDLYAYFEKRPDEYRMTKLADDLLKVERIGPSGVPLQRTELHPVVRQLPREHFFHGVEVLHPELTIPGLVIDDVCNRLGVPGEIFGY